MEAYKQEFIELLFEIAELKCIVYYPYGYIRTRKEVHGYGYYKWKNPYYGG